MPWARGNRSMRGISVMVAALAAATSRADPLADVRRACEEVRRKVLSSRAMATIERTVTFRAGEAARPLPPDPTTTSSRISPGPPPPAARSNRRFERWAFAGEKRFYQPIPGYPTAFDGTFIRARMAYSPTPRLMPNPAAPGADPRRVDSYVQVRGSIARSQIRARTLVGDPIQYGYRLLWRDPDGPETQFWMRDLLKRVQPELTTLPSGNLRLAWQRRIGRQREDAWAEIDPRRNYLIVRLERQWGMVGRDPYVRRARQSVRVLKSQDMGGWHLPTVTVEEETLTDGGRSRLELKLSDIRSDVPDSTFTDIFEPGDWVETETGPYRVGVDGRFEAVSPYPRFDRSGKSPLPLIPIAMAAIAGVLLLAVATLRGKARGRPSAAAAFVRRSR